MIARDNVNKKPVLGLKDRKTGTVKAYVVPDTTRETLFPILLNEIEKGSIVVTDEYNSYHTLGQHFSHGRVTHGAKEYVNGIFHTNGIENFWRPFKTGYQRYISLGKQRAFTGLCWGICIAL